MQNIINFIFPLSISRENPPIDSSVFNEVEEVSTLIEKRIPLLMSSFNPEEIV